MLPLIHPGTILLEEFMEPLGISRNRLSRDLGVPVDRISKIVGGKRAVTADTAVRLSEYFGTTAEFWMNLQSSYELRKLRRDDKDLKIRRSVRPADTAAA